MRRVDWCGNKEAPRLRRWLAGRHRCQTLAADVRILEQAPFRADRRRHLSRAAVKWIKRAAGVDQAGAERLGGGSAADGRGPGARPTPDDTNLVALREAALDVEREREQRRIEEDQPSVRRLKPPTTSVGDNWLPRLAAAAACGCGRGGDLLAVGSRYGDRD
jgi:hypothetical protein